MDNATGALTVPGIPRQRRKTNIHQCVAAPGMSVSEAKITIPSSTMRSSYGVDRRMEPLRWYLQPTILLFHFSYSSLPFLFVFLVAMTTESVCMHVYGHARRVGCCACRVAPEVRSVARIADMLYNLEISTKVCWTSWRRHLDDST